LHKLSHHYSSDDVFVGVGIFPTHFLGQENPSFFDHFRRRSENMKHPFGNKKDLTLGWGGQFDMLTNGQISRF
jgi:hypothetical protein